MRHLMWLLFWVLVLGLIKADANTVCNLSVGELTREYVEHLPSSYDPSKPTPLVLCFHGGGGTAKTMPRFTGFDVLADRENFIVVYPEGIQHHWNDGRETVAVKTDDIGFISALIDNLIKIRHVDPKRVYATGISNGGIFTQRLAVELSDKITAIASVAGNLPESLKDATPSKSISVLMLSGTDDPLVPYLGGEMKKIGKSYGGKVLSAEGTIAFWNKWNGCSDTFKSSAIEDTEPTDGATAIRSEYSGKDESSVILYKIVGGGHTWPGGSQYLPKIMIGNVCRDFDGTKVIWDFFKSHQR